MREKKQITLSELIIKIMIFIILIIIIFYTLNSSYNISRLKKYIAKQQIIQEKVNYIRNQYKTWNKYNPNEYGNYYEYLQECGFINANSSSNLYKLEFEEIIKYYNSKSARDWNKNIDSILTNYCYFSPNDLKKMLDIENIDYYVIINFYTGNIIEKDGVYDNKLNEKIYRQYDSDLGNRLYVESIYNTTIDAKIEIIENKGLSQKVKIYLDSEDKDNLPDILDVSYYTDSSDNLKSCSYLDDYKYVKSEKAVYFTASTTNSYSFIIEDSNFVQYKKIDYEFNFCNPPLLRDDMTGIYWDEKGEEKNIINIYDSNWYNYSKEEMRFANAKTKDGNYWVWIPRYSYKINEDEVQIEFVDNLSSLSTSKKALSGYEIHKAFNENQEITGFWIAKFQANIDNGNINLKPGKTLTVNKMDNGIRNQLMTNNQKEAITLLAKSNKVEIANDLVHYAGGSPDSKGFIENTRYSSTGNIYGVYDLVCSENELTAESNINDEGRFRLVIK